MPPTGYRQVIEEIARLTAVYHRPPGAVKLVAASKRRTAAEVTAMARLGQRDFAENYLQEGVEKIQQTAPRRRGESAAEALCWHFIGHIQSRKCAAIAANFDWAHTVERLKVARKLSQHRCGAPLNVLIQLNLHGEHAKSGVREAALLPLAEGVAQLPNLALRGLMIIPPVEPDVTKQRAVFRRCRQWRDALNARGYALDHLSMGMSADMEAAIAEGATMVRLGTALFGPRPSD